jgi:hypothetical protein
MSDAVSRLNAALEGRYHIERELGEGGMATVYLADDLKHERKVALKVLKPELAAVVGGERFLSEIKTTANLQHPHILALYDSGEADSFLFYVMPYVEGETLRDRLDREKQLPVDEAVKIAVAVAGALDYAHRHGVVHRDIKPGNILMQDAQPVVGDFGIALAVGSAGGARLTETGLSVGTPYYMSPEQATGDMEVGPASDTYALGAVLYELLTGEPPYTGTTAQAVLGRIIQGVPVSATALRRAVPAHVDAAIRKALEKLPADRFSGAQEFAKALQDPAFRHGEARATGVTAAGAGPWRWVAAALAVTTIAFAAAWMSARGASEPVRPVERFAMPFLSGDELAYFGVGAFGLSADGTTLVYRHRVDGQQILVARRWDELGAEPIRETAGAQQPTVSPDGSEVAFVQAGEIKALSFAGGPVRTLGSGFAPNWQSDGYVYFTLLSGGAAVRVAATGGALDTLSVPEESGRLHIVSDVLDESRAVLVFEVDQGSGTSEMFGLDLESRARTDITAGFWARYLPSGHLSFFDVDGSTLMAALFDPGSLELLSQPVPILEGVSQWRMSDSGKLFYALGGGGATGGRVLQMIWVDREGDETPVDPSWTWTSVGPDDAWALSPDGTRMVLRELTEDGPDLWIKRLDAGARSRLTDDETDERWPLWKPGTDSVAFVSTREGGMDVWMARADGLGEAVLVVDAEPPIATLTWSPDGEWLVLRTSGPRGEEGARDIFGFRPGVDTVPMPLMADPGFDEMYPEISPDGRFIAYQSTETDRHEIYVRPFPDVDSGRWQISVNGGRQPRWSPRGDELFFQGPEGQMMVVDVRTEPTLQYGVPDELFEGDPGVYSFDILGNYFVLTPDAQRFLMARSVATAAADEAQESVVRAVLVNNFMEELKVRVPVR